MSLRLKEVTDSESETKIPRPFNSGRRQTLDLGNGSEIVYVPKFVPSDQAWTWFDFLNQRIPWTRPTIRVFGRSVLQPRDTCYVANPGLTTLTYSGYKPHAYTWDDFPPLKDILDAVHEALPGSSFNSLLLNRYKGGNDYVGWHSDDEKVYALNQEIASVSFGCERDFLLKKKPNKTSQRRNDEEPPAKKSKKSSVADSHSFVLKHGSLLVMRGYTQRDWMHSVPKRLKAEATRINLTFRHVIVD
ncbi:DNA oxidative demethylase ALKBH2 [Benincasa hispida]|uniref:DNA oxidative demethylase ALKBH2 n=1 Tax=Benincasa hispida TaxID=102211 RepID=UPI0018FF1407|nr:DNA oxidative demethylase ALKBH2 [Benincasa hispida]XP_038882916.1 DNA oxidative demethylase ALKBH2 [Benincasa hispida]XP_038882917.1 DNA oxidative demethylase ALKBH2 [Benincasa hispida]XP_038882918.1 DNA oxidative demethylase ALKBH2 [Benincasa hispida]XP_038882919.1 DNA oxidative demethylase ALKBH2 [Benincasa hispida]XP_038882920.1 DNA oxidative demethylase ALKBH2 [Benincasa hispida]XP_038882921.1 DNA oxidative demethylase ALKBH2 [Benincasa hispida]